MDNEDNDRRDRSSCKFTICIILMYWLIVSNNDQADTTQYYDRVKQKIKNPLERTPTISQLFIMFQDKQYFGAWTNNKQNSLLLQERGKFEIKISRYYHNKQNLHHVHLILNDGKYSDDGQLILSKTISHSQFQAIRQDQYISLRLKDVQTINRSTPNLITPNQTHKANSSQTTHKQNSQTPTILFQSNLLLQTLNRSQVNLTQYQINFHYDSLTEMVEISLKIETDDINLDFALTHELNNMVTTIIFAIVLSVISILQISSILQIYKAVIQAEDSLAHYSVITLLICSLWDGSLSIFSFLEAFDEDKNLILFIVPSFIFLVLFMNLELRLILMTIQAHSQNNQTRQILFKFNVMTYGGILVVYPILYYSNMSSYLYLGACLILVPQIIANGQQSHRPNLDSPFYKFFVPIRFLLLFYLKCYPWNLFELRPNFILGLFMAAILLMQYYLLWVQSVYGPRKVLPQFLLPTIYNYRYEIEQNIEQGIQIEDQCSICLCNLRQIPADLKLEIENIHQVMKSPCGHKYHGHCLIKWMEIKMQCPQCRTKLPPFQ